MIPCKICGTSSPLHGVADFNKSCEQNRGRFFPLSGVPIYYHRCPECGFLFTGHFDGWSREDWNREVYNDQYGTFDPDGADGSRARSNANLVLTVVRDNGMTRVLDYGGGDGTLVASLPEIDAISYDPMRDDPCPGGIFDLVTAFEVLEHTSTPIETTREALAFVGPSGAFLLSTLTCDGLAPMSMDHWYIAPRNGHVSIHTRKSLDLMFSALGWEVHHASEGLHFATRKADPQ